MYTYATQPQSIGKVLDNGFKLYTFSFTKVFGLALIAAVATNLPNIMISGLRSEDPTIVLQALQSYFWVFPVMMIIGIIFFNTMIFRIDSAVKDPAKGVGVALGVGLRKAVLVIVASILYTLAVMLGLILLVIPGLILSLSLLFYAALIVVDDEGIIASLTKSHRLVWGDWWRTMTVFLIPAIFFIVLYVILGFIVGLMVSRVLPLAESVEAAGRFMGIVSILVSAVGMPLFYSIMLAQLNDLKLRRQGLDLEARLAD